MHLRQWGPGPPMFKLVQDDEDIEMIVDLAKVIWHEHYAPIIGADQVNYMLETYQSAHHIRKVINVDQCQYFLIFAGKRAVGYLSVQSKDDILVLSNLYLLVSQRAKGLGRLAIGHIVDIADRLDLKKIRLRVNKASQRSIRAYQKMGFVKTDDVVADIGGGYTIDDYEMEFALTT